MMRCLSAILGSTLLLFSGMSFATCNSPAAQTSYFTINANGSTTQAVVQVNFSGLSCANNTTVNYPNFQDVIIGFYGGEEKFKLKFTWQSNPTTLSSSSSAVSIGFSVSASRDTGTATYTSSGNIVTIPGAMLASTASNSDYNSAWTAFFLCVLNPARWGTCREAFSQALYKAGGAFSADLIVTYDRIATTCKPENLQLDLPAIPIGKVRTYGVVNEGSAAGNITLNCNVSQTNQKANRTAIVYLKSSSLLASDPSVLQASANNGVGFILENGSGQRIVLARAGDTVDDTVSKLATIPKNMEKNLAATLQIPVRAKYFVFDPDKSRSGSLSATATIVVEHQ